MSHHWAKGYVSLLEGVHKSILLSMIKRSASQQWAVANIMLVGEMDASL